MAKKQLEMKGEGLEKPKAVQEIEDAAEEYVSVRDKRMALTEKEVESRTALIGVMSKHKRSVYKYDGRIIMVTVDEKVKVKKDKDGEKED